MEENKRVNLPPIGENKPEEEKKKKPLGGLLLGKSALRAKWNAGALVARLMASKAALVGLALGVTAIAGLATMTLGDKSERGGGYGEALAFKPYESYSVGNAGAKDSMMSFPYAQGNKEYTDELYRASINPDYSEGDPAAEYEAETAETEASGMEGAAAALQKSGGLASSGGSGKGGGGSGSKNASKNGSAANAAMKGASSQAKGVTATGNAARAASSVRNQGRGAHGNMKTGGLSSDMNKGTSSLVPTALEARKAAAGVQFGEAAVASSGVGAANAEDSSSTDISAPTEESYIELPDKKDDTDQSGGASGMSASGSAAEELAKMTEKLKDYKDKAEELLEDLIEMAGDPEKLCNSATLSTKLADIHENSNDMLDLLQDMNDAGYINDTKMNNWRCNVVLKMKETVDTFISDGVQKYCQAYSNQKQATQYVESCQAAMSANHNVDCSPVVTVANNYINTYNSLIEPFTKQNLKPVKDFESKLGSVKGLSEMLNEGEAAESCAAETQKD